MTSKKKRFDIGKIIEVETVIAAILISVVSWGAAKWYDFETSVTKTRQEIYTHYSVSQNLILDTIDDCLVKKQVAKSREKNRLINRENLVRLVTVSASDISPDSYFNLMKFTRLDKARSLKNICSLNKSELLLLKSGLSKQEIELWKSLELSP
ncbi:MAG: hypothetical protein KDH94_00165 [Coxiellaceae bacterium]|nr:hypothetical protein [Coxiellaceae bacterium]